ncbi:MAG: hypothetical protein JWM87_2049, partial [Candidatus Eremiobacteraeota bacterium]|nr:hypothetical protein [Candidatus Eremiobacteraeota bacterium]
TATVGPAASEAPAFAGAEVWAAAGATAQAPAEKTKSDAAKSREEVRVIAVTLPRAFRRTLLLLSSPHARRCSI